MRVFIDIANTECFMDNIINRMKFISAKICAKPSRYYEYANNEMNPVSNAEVESEPDKIILLDSTDWKTVKEYLI